MRRHHSQPRFGAIFRFVIISSTAGLAFGCCTASLAQVANSNANREPGKSFRVRFATFNTALNREKKDALASEVGQRDSVAVARIAEVIQRVRPDVILLNEVDYDSEHSAIDGLLKNYLGVSQNNQALVEYPHQFTGEVNTGVDSGLDLNRDGKTQTADDAFGFGLFPGQYGMVVLSRYPLGQPVRTFQKFLWQDMPGALWPMNPQTSDDFYSPEAKKIFRLSSKSHWDVPIQIENRTVHVIAAHPTPPVFDGKEDRNGRRNHDEIRLIADYLNGSDYVYDDARQNGGLAANASFVVMGDMNADPIDGDSSLQAIKQLLEHPLVNSAVVPKSNGAREAAAKSGQANESHRGDPAADTGDFNDKSVGNLRLDYVLPSKDLKVVDSGVFWPADNDPAAGLAGASDHHLVWIDVEFSPQ